MGNRHVHASWTVAEIGRLRKDFPAKSRRQLEAAFPRHPWGSIRMTARKLGLRRPPRVNKYQRYAARHVPVFDFGWAATLAANSTMISTSEGRSR